MHRFRCTLVLLACTAGFSAAGAQDAGYVDDRSDPAALMRSYYNAISRKEYSRAWDYYGEDKPAPTLQAFTDGYATTGKVDLFTGNVSEEGAAGSVFYELPVAIRASGDDGSTHVFAGCYSIRLANPQIQGEPFHPMHIVKGTLEEAEEPAENAVPEKCGDGPSAPPRDAMLDKAQALFADAYGDICTGGSGSAGDAPEAYAIGYRLSSDEDGAPERQARLFRFFCLAGAYNEVHVYYVSDEIEGLRELHFATPDMDIRYENDDSEGKVDSMRIIGFTAENQLVNSSYDPQSLSITSHTKWRGVGDASSGGAWLFRDGRFTLIRYDVDASYDGQINPETVLDYDQAP